VDGRGKSLIGHLRTVAIVCFRVDWIGGLLARARRGLVFVPPAKA
jgi:hypothetical protein